MRHKKIKLIVPNQATLIEKTIPPQNHLLPSKTNLNVTLNHLLPSKTNLNVTVRANGLKICSCKILLRQNGRNDRHAPGDRVPAIMSRAAPRYLRYPNNAFRHVNVVADASQRHYATLSQRGSMTSVSTDGTIWATHE